MLEKFYETNKSLIHRLALVIGFLVAIYLFFTTFLSYVAPFVIGYVFSLIMEPFVRFAGRRLKLGRGICAFLSIFLLIGILSLMGTMIVTRVITEARGISENLQENAGDYLGAIDSLANRMYEYIPLEMREFFDASANSLVTTFVNFFSDIAKSGSISIVSGLPGTVVNFALILVSSFFFIKDKFLISASLKKFLPKWMSGGIITVRAGFLRAISGYIKAQLIIMSVTTSICILGLTIIRSPYSFVLGILIGLVDALPVLGSGAILWPWALFCLLSRDYPLAIGLMVIYGAVFLTRQILEPKVLSSQIGVHPLLTLISIYAGLKLFGAIGLIAGPVIVVTIKIILEISDKQEPPEGSPGDTEMPTVIASAGGETPQR